MSKTCRKILTKNDTAETGGHQAGITIPKRPDLLDFFPALDLAEFNPEDWIVCIDSEGERWEMRYVYYNGKTFSPRLSTRNEYRITYMTKFFRKWNAQSKDAIVFKETNKRNTYDVRIEKLSVSDAASKNNTEEQAVVILRGWSQVY